MLQGCAVVGCMVAGLMGVNEEGHAHEVDPTDTGAARKGVTLLLGRVGPGSRVCVAADLQVPPAECTLLLIYMYPFSLAQPPQGRQHLGCGVVVKSHCCLLSALRCLQQAWCATGLQQAGWRGIPG